jgi:hypothetical protein
VPRRRPVAIPPQKAAAEPPRMHALFDLLAAVNVTHPYVEGFIADPRLSESYGLLSLIGAARSITTTEVAARLGIPITTASDRIRRLESTFPAWREATVQLEKELAIPSREIGDAIRELDRAMRAILTRRGAAVDG